MTDRRINDPFADDFEKIPSVSWKNAPEKKWFTFTVTKKPERFQSIDYATKEPATWKDGNPKMAVSTEVVPDSAVEAALIPERRRAEVEETGQEKRRIVANIPSALFIAMRDAQKEAGELIDAGGKLAIKITGWKETDLDPQRLFAVKYQPPKRDAFADDSSAVADDDAPPF